MRWFFAKVSVEVLRSCDQFTSMKMVDFFFFNTRRDWIFIYKKSKRETRRPWRESNIDKRKPRKTFKIWDFTRIVAYAQHTNQWKHLANGNWYLVLTLSTTYNCTLSNILKHCFFFFLKENNNWNPATDFTRLLVHLGKLSSELFTAFSQKMSRPTGILCRGRQDVALVLVK